MSLSPQKPCHRSRPHRDPAPAADPVDALIKSIRIPPRPSLLADLQRELASPTRARAIGRIVASDVGMSGALLKLANSSIFGGRRKAKSIEQAILFLGINQVAALMTGLLARQAIPANSAALASFWDVSTRRAHAMVFLSRRLRIGAPDVAHTFGLFCDTGVPLLMDRFADYGATFADASPKPTRPSPRSKTSATAPATRRSAPCWRVTGACRATCRLGDPAPPRLRGAGRRAAPRRGALAGGAVAAGRKRDLPLPGPCRIARMGQGRRARHAPISASTKTKPPNCSTSCTKPSHDE
jgi:hypothetical protein